MKRILIGFVSLVIASQFLACKTTAQASSTAKQDTSSVDFAAHPQVLSPKDRPGGVNEMSTVQLDALYSRIEAGTFPSGAYYAAPILGTKQKSMTWRDKVIYESANGGFSKEFEFDAEKRMANAPSLILKRSNKSAVECTVDSYDPGVSGNLKSWHMNAKDFFSGTTFKDVYIEMRMVIPGYYLARVYIDDKQAFYMEFFQNSRQPGYIKTTSWENDCK